MDEEKIQEEKTEKFIVKVIVRMAFLVFNINKIYCLIFMLNFVILLYQSHQLIFYIIICYLIYYQPNIYFFKNDFYSNYFIRCNLFKK